MRAQKLQSHETSSNNPNKCEQPSNRRSLSIGVSGASNKTIANIAAVVGAESGMEEMTVRENQHDLLMW